MSGDIFGCRNWVGGVPGIERPEKLLSVLEGTGQLPHNRVPQFQMSMGLWSESPNLEAGPGLELKGHKCRQVSRCEGYYPSSGCFHFFSWK